MTKIYSAEKALTLIRKAAKTHEHLLVAIDGRCASGKTTLANELAHLLNCQMIRMDHFFLRPEQRTQERYAEAGGNVDRERFLQEVLIPLQAGKPFSYQPFDCHTMTLGDPIFVDRAPVTIVEGTYSCHPALRDAYHLRFFLTVDGEEQLRRIAARNGEAALAVFKARWIPLEEAYFAAFDVEKFCICL